MNIQRKVFPGGSDSSLPAKQETQVQSLGQEDPLKKEMATHSSILAWKIPWMEEPGRLRSMGSQGVRHNWATNTFYTKKSQFNIFISSIVMHLFIYWPQYNIEIPVSYLFEQNFIYCDLSPSALVLQIFPLVHSWFLISILFYKDIAIYFYALNTWTFSLAIFPLLFYYESLS